MAYARAGVRTLRKLTVVAVSVIAATLLTFPLVPTVIHSRDLLFIAAVILVSRYEGAIPGICAALLSVVVFDWYFDQSPHAFDFAVGNGLRIVVFIAVSLLITYLDRQRRRATERLITTNAELQKALNEVKTLRGILPICAYCKKIRTEPETWMAVENYIRQHSDAEFSHGVCPDCLRQHFPEISRGEGRQSPTDRQA